MLHAVDPKAVVILAGLSDQGMPATDFLTRVYELGAKNCFDVIAYHPYGQIRQLPALQEQFQTIAQKYGDTKPVWFNEFGEAHDSDKAASLKQVLQQRDLLDGFFWYNLRDYDEPQGDGYGLLNHDFTPKRVYSEFKTILTTK